MAVFFISWDTFTSECTVPLQCDACCYYLVNIPSMAGFKADLRVDSALIFHSCHNHIQFPTTKCFMQLRV